MNPHKLIPDDLDRDLEDLGLMCRIDSDESRLGVGPCTAAYCKRVEDLFTMVGDFWTGSIRNPLRERLYLSKTRERATSTPAILESTETALELQGEIDFIGARSSEASSPSQVVEEGVVANPEIVPLNVLSRIEFNVKGKVRTGEEIVRAIPDLGAFRAELQEMKNPKFLEINEEGQLVMMDGCKAYGLNEDFLTARDRQTRVVYRDEAGKTQLITGHCFTVDKETGDLVLNENKGTIKADSILMSKGLPRLQWDGEKHTGECTRIMNYKGYFRNTYVWTEDASLDSACAQFAYWNYRSESVASDVVDSDWHCVCLGSCGVLRVNLVFES